MDLESRVSSKLSNIINCNNYIFCGYSRNCLYLLLKALNLNINDEIIVPGFICESIIQVIRQAALRPIFVDVDYESVNISPEKIIKAITSKTKIIYVIHSFGICSKIDEISSIAKKNSLILIEDIAHSLGSSIKDRQLGTFGQFVILSFTKTMINYQGGAIATNDVIILNKMKELKTSLTSIDTRNQWLKKAKYNAYRILCSIWECRGSLLSLFIIKLLSLFKNKSEIKSLSELNPSCFGISKLSLGITYFQLSFQLRNKYKNKRNKKYISSIWRKSKYIQCIPLHEKQTGLLPNYICGFILNNNNFFRLFSLPIWKNSSYICLKQSQKNYKSLRLFPKSIW